VPLTRAVLAAPALAELRARGDPPLEELTASGKLTPDDLRRVREAVRVEGLHGVAATVVDDYPSLMAVVGNVDIEPDPGQLRMAQRLFAQFSPEISGALLLAALPQSYATEFGARVLEANAELESNLVRRIRGTALFLMVVMQRATVNPLVDSEAVVDELADHGGVDDEPTLRLWKPDPLASGLLPWKMCAALRLYHHAIRHHLKEPRPKGGAGAKPPIGVELGTPINQEDLLGMLLTFSISVFEVLEKYGICWTLEEQLAYLHAWDVVGAHLGIGSTAANRTLADLDPSIASWVGLRPDDVDSTRALLQQIRERQWIAPSPTSALNTGSSPGLRSGRLLTSALLDELAAAMPTPLKLVPIAVMRALNPDVVRRRLSLGHNGIVIRALGQLPKRRHVVGRFTAVHAPNAVTGRVLRMMANDVTARASLRFLQESDDFFIPGLEEWSGGLQSGR
jgi:hypothetical protein